MNHRWIVGVCLLGATLAPWAQTVYESKGKDGPVFSDKPSTGATSVELPPPNVVSAPAAPPPAPAPSAPARPHYSKLSILMPEAQGMVHTNTGAFDVAARVQPPLRPADRVRVQLDGRLVPTVFRSTKLRLSEADWQATAAGHDGEHVLQLAVVDAQGLVLVESAPVRFFVKRATVGAGRR